jgi:hypothetical protein
LTFGSGNKAGVPGTLYFTSGPDGEQHGLFGSLEPVDKKKNHDHHDNDRDDDDDDDDGNGQRR